MRKKILLLYPFYWPLYKAGGPVQSLVNMVAMFSDHADFYVVSHTNDIDGTPAEVEVKANEWSKGPAGENILYVDKISPGVLFRIFRDIKPDKTFVNGIFNLNTTLPGIVFGKIFRTRLIISPRGMLQEWALARRARLKRIVLLFLKLLLSKNERWHVTDERERSDVYRIFGERQQVFVASNIPRKPITLHELKFDQKKIKLVFLSLINPNKNLHLVIEAVSKRRDIFELDIYGPVIDELYWGKCTALMDEGIPVHYNGPVLPWNVQGVMQKHHFFVLPTDGENFGHAIFDALSAGVPVVIPRTTPWQGIDSEQCGYFMDAIDNDALDVVFEQIAQLTYEQYAVLQKGSLAYANQYFTSKEYVKDYGFLLE